MQRWLPALTGAQPSGPDGLVLRRSGTVPGLRITRTARDPGRAAGPHLGGRAQVRAAGEEQGRRLPDLPSARYHPGHLGARRAAAA